MVSLTVMFPSVLQITNTQLIMQKIVIIFFKILGMLDSRTKIFSTMYAPNINLSVSFLLDVVLWDFELFSVSLVFIAVAEPII